MVKQLGQSIVVGAFLLGLCGAALAATVSGTISSVDEGGRAVGVKGKDGKEVKVRVSNSGTEITKGGKPVERTELKTGGKAKVTYDDKDERKTASKIELQ